MELSGIIASLRSPLIAAAILNTFLLVRFHFLTRLDKDFKSKGEKLQVKSEADVIWRSRENEGK